MGDDRRRLIPGSRPFPRQFGSDKPSCVDPEPDFWARSARGPWRIAVNKDCAQQFKAKYGDLTCIRIQQVDIPVCVTYKPCAAWPVDPQSGSGYPAMALGREVSSGSGVHPASEMSMSTTNAEEMR